MLIKIISLMLCMTYIKTCDKKSCATCPKKTTCGNVDRKLGDLEELPINGVNSNQPTQLVNSPRSGSKDNHKEQEK